ncbi:NAD(P)/FAD-dependent oxidoreductase [Streptomyces ipomoeae]|uniref:NAD(P)/FAD-dependent oxidoreductase n=1 Tax=Streptomyces ipomoeae TaxID=103232 RepID=UPI0011478B45|nr:FAD-dependent oxidoreductase [Streptomyces ipomoeae]MDX2936160.1 FAD-dependent oxidoreductase [Streptomyces ipomoeae]TQE31225.1 NAD(P)/FAD-dependent oxidoreductase [Streptomyces ipomoeae]
MTAAGRAVVVGGSLAGATAVDELRAQGWDGSITLVGDEPHPAYARPPLSKGVLKGTEAADSVPLPTTGEADVLLGTTATGLDLDARRVRVTDGNSRGYDLPYDKLVIATGARARTLGHPGERVLRTLDDALRLHTELTRASSLLVLGGGFLGMEIASAATELGVSVTVVDVRQPLVGSLGSYLAGLFGEAARERRVRMVVAPDGVTPMPYGARLADGTRLETDLVVTAVGCLPNTEWLTGSGLTLLDGVVVDERCRAGSPDVVAVGDVAAFPTGDGRFRRTPHWDSAVAQARAGVAALLRGDEAEAHVLRPYFWTEAFGLAVKLAGTLPAVGQPVVLKGSPAEHSALLRWDRPGGQVAAALNHRIPVARLRALVS